MARSFSLLKRRPGYVDLGIPTRAGIGSYQFFAVSNFDGTPVQFDTVPLTGKASASVPEVPVAPQAFRNYTRFVFNPADYTALSGASPTITDDKPMWLYIKPVTIAGSVGSAEALHLILPYDSSPNRMVTLSGTVPGSSLELQLPGQCFDLFANSQSGHPILLGFEPNAPQINISIITTTAVPFKSVESGFSQLFVQGSGGTAVLNATFALRQPAR